MKLDDWQEEILKAEGNILLCTGRQVGKTTIFAAKAAERLVNQKNCRIVAVSLTEDQAFLMRFMVEDYLKKNYKAYLKVPKKKKPTKNKINLNNGSSYIVRPVGNTGDAVRGFTADVLIVDEAAYMPELMWIAAKPTLLTTGGDIWLCSTPHGKKGYFYECFENKAGRFKVWHISSEEVITERPITEGWTETKRVEAMKILEEEKKEMSELQYAQEYLGKFVEDLMRYFPDELIDKVCTLKRPEVTPKHNNYMGVDIARLGGDHTSFQVIHKEGDQLIHIYSEQRTKWLTTQTEQRIVDLTKQLHLRKVYIDAGAGSLGVGVLDHLMPILRSRVVAVNNRQIVTETGWKKVKRQRLLKEDLYDNLRNLMETKQIKLLDLEEVKLSLRSVQYEYVRKPNQKSSINIFATPHEMGDLTEALIRAAYCSKEKNIKPLVYSFRV